MLRHLGPASVIFIGVIISALGALWAARQQGKSAEALRNKSDEIAALNREIAQSIIGGDSFCYLSVSPLKQPDDQALLTLVHQGKYPLYDLGVRIVDVDKFQQVVSRDFSALDLFKIDTNVSVGNLAVGQAAMIGNMRLPSLHELRFNIFFSARNGFFVQLLRLRKVNGVWRQAIRVTRRHDGPEAVILEKIDSEYGEPNW